MSEQVLVRPSWQNTFTALKYPNYRLWFVGQMVSLFGTWMQTTAQGYLVYELTRSPAFLGYVGFAGGIPAWLFTLYGGVVADRMSRRTLILITQTGMMILALVLAALTFAGMVQPWHIIVLAFGLGVANAFDAPARQAFVLEMVDREDLVNAIALNSTMFNTATVVGPAAAGITYALFGPAWCFTLNGISFIAVIVALSMMKLQPLVKPIRQNSAGADMKEGIRYAISDPTIRTLLGIAAITALFGISVMTLMPAWAVNVLNGDAKTNGWLQSARGVGALIGALLIASLGRFEFKGKLMTLGLVLYPIVLLLFAFTNWLPLSLLALVVSGIAVVFIFNLANALVQTLVPDNLRGRVMSLHTLNFFGMMPIGALWIGALAEYTSAPIATITSSLIFLCFTTLIWVRAPWLRSMK